MKGHYLVILGIINVISSINAVTDETVSPGNSQTDLSTSYDNECTSESSIDETTEPFNYIETGKTSTKLAVISNKTNEGHKNETIKNLQVDKVQKSNQTTNTTGKSKIKTPKPKVINPAKADKSTQPQNKTSNITTNVDQLKTKPKHLLKLKSCNCDTHSDICDINCCCDEDCSKDEKKAFSQCEEESNYIHRSDYCFSPNVMYRNNTPYRSFNLRPGLLCIARNNIPDKIKYYAHQVVKHKDEITNILKRRSKYHWQIKLKELSRELDDDKPFIYGSPVWILTNNSNELSLDKLTILQEGVTSMCSTNQYTVGYIEDIKSSCLVKTPNDDCQNFSLLSATAYKDLLILVSPNLINSSTDLEVITLDKVFIKAMTFICSRGKCKKEINVPPLYYDAKNQICNNTVKKVEYYIRHNGTEGIKEANCFIHLENITLGRGLLRIEYDVKFDWVKTKETNFMRSGNPGYLSGKPLIIGNKTEKTLEGIKNQVFVISSQNPNSWLTLPSSDTNGFCSGNRNTITFNENIRSECTMLIRQDNLNEDDNCTSLYMQIQGYLFGKSNPDEIWISSWGDPKLEDPTAWAPLVFMTKQLQPSCYQLITAISYNFIYSITGVLDSPQPKIIGAILKTTETPFSCLSEKCLIALTTSVTFTSVTAKPRLTYPKHPALRLHLPRDFFYPFSSSSGSNISYNNFLCFFLVLCVNVKSLLIRE